LQAESLGEVKSKREGENGRDRSEEYVKALGDIVSLDRF